MPSPSQKRFVGIGEQRGIGIGVGIGRRSPSLEKSQVPFFAGWHESTLSLYPTPGLHPPQPPSPQPSPKTRFSSSDPWEVGRPLRLGEQHQGRLNDDPSSSLHSLDDSEYNLTPKPVELHPAAITHVQRNTALATPETSDLSSAGEMSEASSFAYALRRERLNKRSFKKAMIPPPHLSLASPIRPPAPLTAVSSPAIVMQSSPPQKTQAPLRSMTFSEALSSTQEASPPDNPDDRVSPMTSRQRPRNRRVRPSYVRMPSVDYFSSITGSVRMHESNSSDKSLMPPPMKREKSSETVKTEGSVRQLPKNSVSFAATATHKPETPEEDVHFHEEVLIYSVLRSLTMSKKKQDALRQPPKQHQTSKKKRFSLRLTTASSSSTTSDTSEKHGYLPLLRSRTRRRGSQAAITVACPVQITVGDRTISPPLTPLAVQRLRRGSYFAADGREYARRPVPGLSFLPSEMQRVNTPPLGALIVPGNKSSEKMRGFFFDTRHLTDAEDDAVNRRDSVAASPNLNPPPSPRILSPKKVLSAKTSKGLTEAPDYFQQRMDQVETEEDDEQEVAMDVPDHLPNSPLCPLHPKHPHWGGSLLCPMHGKGRMLAARRMSRDGKTMRGLL